MFKIDNNAYERLAEELASQISYSSIFSGSITIETDDADIQLITTIIPYFKEIEYPEGGVQVLQNIIPVWWEVHTTTLDGEVVNDFDFQTFKEYICQW